MIAPALAFGRRPGKAAVVRQIVTSQPSASDTTAISWSAAAPSSAWARRSAAWAVPVLPTTAARSSVTVPFVAPTDAASRLTARVCGPAMIQ